MSSSTAIDVKVLVVDDLPENLTAMQALLAGPGIELLLARSGDEALELLLAHDVGLALLDVQMPEMDGFELAELMRGSERTRRIPIIFVTAGLHDAGRVFRGYDAGAVDFLFKPVDPRILNNKVATFVELQRQRTQLTLQVEALRASEELRQRIIDASSDRIMLVDLQNHVQFLLGQGSMRDRERAPTPPGELQADWDRVWSESELASDALAAARDGNPARFQTRALLPSMRDGEWDVILSPLRGSDGIVERVVASARDVREFVELHRQLSETLRLNETFVAAIGHDLRTPLNNILMSSELLAESAERDATGRLLLSRLTSSAQRMRGMIDELYDMARARLGGGIHVTPDDSVDLGKLAADVTHELTSVYVGKTVDLSAHGDVVGAWDTQRLMQVVSNLIGNALRHGTGAVSVDLDGNDRREVVLRVKNAGEIPEQLRQSVFDPFKRGGARASRSEGLGLGLFIARQIVEAHGGTIGLTCEQGMTAFSVHLPRRAELAPALGTQPA